MANGSAGTDFLLNGLPRRICVLGDARHHNLIKPVVNIAHRYQIACPTICGPSSAEPFAHQSRTGACEWRRSTGTSSNRTSLSLFPTRSAIALHLRNVLCSRLPVGEGKTNRSLWRLRSLRNADGSIKALNAYSEITTATGARQFRFA
jgi:hypothetical protein